MNCNPEEWMPMSEFAKAARIRHQDAMTEMLLGLVDGARVGSRWYVSRASVARRVEQRIVTNDGPKSPSTRADP